MPVHTLGLARRVIHDEDPLSDAVFAQLTRLGAKVEKTKHRERLTPTPHGDVPIPYALQQLALLLRWPQQRSAAIKRKRRHRSFSPLEQIELGTNFSLEGYACLAEQPLFVFGTAEHAGRQLYLMASMFDEPSDPQIHCIPAARPSAKPEHIDKLSSFLKKLR